LIDDGKAALGLPRTMYPGLFVDGGQIVQHFVRPVHVCFQETEHFHDLTGIYPKGREIVFGVLDGEYVPGKGMV
jgi:hypothetical protein